MNSLIRDMALVERPRERLGQLGVEALKDEELLAIIIRTGYQGHDVLQVARDILVQHPLADLLKLPYTQLCALRGMGTSRAAALLSGIELAHRVHQRPATQPTIQTVDQVSDHAIELRDKKKEHLMAFFLNARHQLIAKEIISIGTLTASLAHPREIFSPAIGKAAAGVILVHNHPSGDPSPSDEDIRLTKRISQAGHILGIELLDHVIIAEKGSYSFRTAGSL